ncbi:AbfB domain-containing protein [Winogradskya humida]|uniref:AbfB domain-containing protein n=1 Tax=Winogradskya humida TaxID=113566 RepID=UPI001941445A|nr:AbfB domain-containing protein [Actinoplanes humidus]
MAIIGAGLLVLFAAGGIALAPDNDPPQAHFVTMAPIPLDPSPTTAEVTDPAPTYQPPRRGTQPAPPATEKVSSKTPTSPAPTTTSAPATVGPKLVVDTTIGLAPADTPGSRLRHWDFQARISTLTSASPAQDRADSRYIVRKGAADARCFSFESDNYRGRFLRHRDYKLYLDQVDGSELFAADATFCPVDRQNDTFTLRSKNYPDRSIARRGELLYLTRAATTFTVQPPL